MTSIFQIVFTVQYLVASANSFFLLSGLRQLQLASLLGAMIFLLLGYAIARKQSVKPSSSTKEKFTKALNNERSKRRLAEDQALQLQSSLRATDNQKQTFVEEINALRAELESKSSTAEDVVEQQSDLHHIAHYENQILQLKQQLEQQTESEKSDAQNDALKQECDALRKKAQLVDTREKQLDRMLDENSKLKSENQTNQQLNIELESVRQSLREAQSKAQTAESQNEELSRLYKENRQLRQQQKELTILREENSGLDDMRTEHQSLRVEHDVLLRKVEELETANAESINLRNQVNELSRQLGESKNLRRQFQDAKAQLYAAGIKPRDQKAATMPLRVSSPTKPAESGRIGEILAPLTNNPGMRAVVVADNQGLVICGDGDEEYHDEIAALSGLAEGLASKTSELLPLSDVMKIFVYDINDLIVLCRFFQCNDDKYVLATLSGQTPPTAETIEAVVEVLKVAIQGSE